MVKLGAFDAMGELLRWADQLFEFDESLMDEVVAQRVVASEMLMLPVSTYDEKTDSKLVLMLGTLCKVAEVYQLYKKQLQQLQESQYLLDLSESIHSLKVQASQSSNHHQAAATDVEDCAQRDKLYGLEKTITVVEFEPLSM